MDQQHTKELNLPSLKSIFKFSFISVALGDDGLGELNLRLEGIIFTTLIVFV